MAPEIYQGIVAYQSGDSTAAWTLVQKFTPLLKHYAFILHREDGFEDLQCYFLSLLKTLSLERLSSTSDGAIIKYIAISIHLINSGATALDGSGACVDAEGNHVMKPFWEMTDADIKACLNATDWCRADYEYFRGGGYSSHFRCKAEMPVTMLRFNIVEGIGPVLQIAEGWTADLPDEIHNTIDKRTDPTWPTTWFCPRLTGQGAFTDVYSVMANWGANHGVTVYGHVGADLITLASMLRIPVTMHNVPAEKVYRPHAWASFGTQDQQAADYAACKQYGPLYR